MHSLPIFVRLQGRSVILIGNGEAATAKRRLLERAGAIVCDEDEEARIAIVAIENDQAAHDAIARLKARGILVNAVDRPDHCDFTLPAIIDRDPVLIAIGTGGASAGLAKSLRQRFESILPQSIGQLAINVAAARDRIKARWPDPADRRRAVDAAFDPSGTLDPFGANTGVDTWLQQPDTAHATGLHILTIRSDDADDLTLRQARLLGQADHIFHHPDIGPALLSRARADASRTLARTCPKGQVDGLTLFLDKA